MSIQLTGLGLALAAGIAALGGPQSEDDDAFNPLSVDVIDAIECKLDPRTYNGFAFTLDDDKVGSRARGWKKLESANVFLSQYELPEPITVAGRSTRTIVFSSSAIMAVLDADPHAIAPEERIANAVDDPNKFLGERMIATKTEADLGMKFVSTVKRVLSNVTSHPRKALLGCSYVISTEE